MELLVGGAPATPWRGWQDATRRRRSSALQKSASIRVIRGQLKYPAFSCASSGKLRMRGEAREILDGDRPVRAGKPQRRGGRGASHAREPVAVEWALEQFEMVARQRRLVLLAGRR